MWSSWWWHQALHGIWSAATWVERIKTSSVFPQTDGSVSLLEIAWSAAVIDHTLMWVTLIWLTIFYFSSRQIVLSTALNLLKLHKNNSRTQSPVTWEEENTVWSEKPRHHLSFNTAVNTCTWQNVTDWCQCNWLTLPKCPYCTPDLSDCTWLYMTGPDSPEFILLFLTDCIFLRVIS